MTNKSSQEATSHSYGEKYRVKRLEDFYGNEDVIKGIETFLNKDAPPQAILLTGPTGVGKTTLAKIIAKRLNGVSSFKKSLAKDVNCGKEGGVDEARKLIEASRFLPHLKYNVIILDEVHMLTRNAVSALLKELEEPSKTIWILCTNEPQSLLDTFKGRCTTFRLQYPELLDGMRLLARVCKKEGVFLPPKRYKKMLKAIYEASNGDPRTMLNTLNGLALRYGNSKKDITPDMVMGVVTGEQVTDKNADACIEHILNGEPAKLASMVNGYYYKMDFKFTSDVLKRFVWYQQDAARKQPIKTPIKEDRIRISYKVLSGIVKRIGEALRGMYGMPSIVTAPIIYSVLLDAAMMVHQEKANSDD